MTVWKWCKFHLKYISSVIPLGFYYLISVLQSHTVHQRLHCKKQHTEQCQPSSSDLCNYKWCSEWEITSQTYCFGSVKCKEKSLFAKSWDKSKKRIFSMSASTKQHMEVSVLLQLTSRGERWSELSVSDWCLLPLQ